MEIVVSKHFEPGMSKIGRRVISWCHLSNIVFSETKFDKYCILFEYGTEYMGTNVSKEFTASIFTEIMLLGPL
jgi:hypothetical protein